jgi:hypothetical protein
VCPPDCPRLWHLSLTSRSSVVCCDRLSVQPGQESPRPSTGQIGFYQPSSQVSAWGLNPTTARCCGPSLVMRPWLPTTTLLPQTHVGVRSFSRSSTQYHLDPARGVVQLQHAADVGMTNLARGTSWSHWLHSLWGSIGPIWRSSTDRQVAWPGKVSSTSGLYQGQERTNTTGGSASLGHWPRSDIAVLVQSVLDLLHKLLTSPTSSVILAGPAAHHHTYY